MNRGDENKRVSPASARTLRFLFRGQAFHLLFLIALVPSAMALGQFPTEGRRWLGFTTAHWFWFSILAAIIHQIYVWLGWRLQLGWQLFTLVFGSLDFIVFCLFFFPLLVARPALVFVVAWLDHGTLALPAWLAVICGGVLMLPALATGYSVTRYFGFARAAGADHFRERYRNMPLVRQGVFQWTDNAMYTLGFFGLWSIALLLQSQLALIAAIFQHGYIWAHYLGTEKPDLDLLYRQTKASKR